MPVRRLFSGAWVVSQHTHGTDNARCLISLALMCGQTGRAGTGLHPLRGQNNVQGASDAGMIPMVFPDYSAVTDEKNLARFEKLWDAKLDPEPGLTVVEIVHAIHDGAINGMYILGENPAMSDPDVNHARAALAKLDHLVVQDIFLTETAMFADVVLPATAVAGKERHSVEHQPPGADGPQGAAGTRRSPRGLGDYAGSGQSPRS